VRDHRSGCARRSPIIEKEGELASILRISLPWLSPVLLCSAGAFCLSGTVCMASAEVKLDKDYLAGLIEKLPPLPFDKADQSHGTVHGYRLVAIDPQSRRFLVVCQVEGEFRSSMPGPFARRASRGGTGDPSAGGAWRKFRFEVRVGVNIEPGRDGTPRFRVTVEEVKRKELEGLAGTMALLLGRYFDDVVTRVAAGKASQLSDKLNAEIVKRVAAFKEYGVFSGIDYTPQSIALHFDMTRFRLEGVIGHVYPVSETPPLPGTVPLYRAVHRRSGAHLYTISMAEADNTGFRREGIAGYVYDRPVPATVPLYRWRVLRDDFYTTARDGQGCSRLGYRLEAVTCYLYPDAKPGTVPFYQFIDPRSGQHFYTVHPYAEFAK
jgi:hypothetical protein